MSSFDVERCSGTDAKLLVNFGVTMLVLRRESFGGILGRRSDYGFNVVNRAAYDLIELLNRSSSDDRANLLHSSSTAMNFALQLQERKFLNNNFCFDGEQVCRTWQTLAQ